MRWHYPALGEEKTVRKFLLLPLTVNGETRWLEMAMIKYCYHRDGWIPFAWCD